MKRPDARGKGKPKKKKAFNARRSKFCKFCVEKIDSINYKDVRLLSSFVSERGKITPRRITGVCAPHQRDLQTAIKRARQLALVPYVAE